MTEDERTPHSRTETRTRTRTTCPRCAVGCRLERRPDRARAVGVAGPANPDGRLCPRGVAAFDAVDDRDRLERPLLGRGDDREPVPWATAYEAVVRRFERVLDAHGPDALAFLGAPRCTNEENYLLQKLARTLGTNNVDNRARLCHVTTTRLLSERVGRPATTNGLDDLREADVVVVAGANPAARQPVAFNASVRPAVADGATLVHVEPAANETTRLADVHLAPRPGTDALVFDLLSAHVRAAGGVDRAFVDRRTRGYEAFAAALAGFDRERAASVADVDGDAVADVADRVAEADRVAALVGTGIEGAGGERPPAAALLDLLLLTGSLGRRGTGLFVLRGLVNEQGATDAGCVPDRLPGHRPVTDPAARARVAAEWGRPPPARPGRTADELLDGFGEGIRAALVVGEDPAVSKRDADRVRRRLEALDALVVLDVAPSGTTRHADVVLPAATGVERDGTVTSLDRRVQRVRRTAAPPGEARPDFEILADLGRRLVDGDGDGDGGNGGAFDYADVSEAFAELTRVAPTHAGLSYGDADGDGRRWPADAADGVLYRERFETPHGRAAFAATPPTVDVDAGRGGRGEDGDGLHLVTGGRAGGVEEPRASGLRIHPGDADERGVASGGRVVVSDGATTVEATATVDDGVRRGTVYLPAAVADPFLRRGTSTVDVDPAPEGTDGRE